MRNSIAATEYSEVSVDTTTTAVDTFSQIRNPAYTNSYIPRNIIRDPVYMVHEVYMVIGTINTAVQHTVVYECQVPRVAYLIFSTHTPGTYQPRSCHLRRMFDPDSQFATDVTCCVSRERSISSTDTYYLVCCCESETQNRACYQVLRRCHQVTRYQSRRKLNDRFLFISISKRSLYFSSEWCSISYTWYNFNTPGCNNNSKLYRSPTARACVLSTSAYLVMRGAVNGEANSRREFVKHAC